MPDRAMSAVLLLCGAPLLAALLATRLRGRALNAAALLGAAVPLAAAIVGIARGLDDAPRLLGGLPQVDRAFGHPVPLFGVLLDPLAAVVLLGVTGIGFACVLFSLDYVGPGNREHPTSEGRNRYFFWMLAFIAAMGGLVTAGTLFQLFLFWELTTLCSWALIGHHHGQEEAQRAADKAFLMTGAGGLGLLGAVAALIALTGSAGFDAFTRLAPPWNTTAGPVLAVLLLIAAWAKSGQVPFHGWLPSAMVAPSPVSAYLHAAAMVNAGVFLVLRLATAGLAAGAPALPVMAAGLVAAMALVTLVVSVAQFFFVTDLKRLLALSTISHLSLVLLGAALGLAGSTIALRGAALHVLAHGTGKALLFLSVGALVYSTGSRRIADYSGALRRTPVAAVGFLVGALTVTGVPPFAGFWSKLGIVRGAFELGGAGVAAGAVVLAESVLAFAWFLWIGQKVFLGTPSPMVAAIASPTRTMNATLVLLAVLCLLVTLAGLPLAQMIGR